jgi:peptidoglycan/LPS O-acetylase OafA/YrhL
MLSRALAAAPSAVAPPPGNPRFELLDAMRGIAAGMILLSHSAGITTFAEVNALGAYTARLNMGVALFFLLSGFLLYRPFVAARLEGRPPIGIRDFARRRILRIVPAYWVALTLLGLWPGLAGLWDSGDWWRYYAFAQIYTERTAIGGIPPAWSLAVEISFYLALPFLAAALARAGRGLTGTRAIRRELVLLAGLAAGSLAFRTVVEITDASVVLLNTLPAYLDWFAYGMILAVVSVWAHGREGRVPVLRQVVRRPWLAWAAFLVPFWIVSTQLGLPRNWLQNYTSLNFLGEHLLYPLCAALLLLPAIFTGGAGGWPRRLLAWRPLAWFGLVSYGVFLYHEPLMRRLDQWDARTWLPGSEYLSLSIVALAAATVAAALSYYLVERPALRFKDRGSSSRRRSRASSASAPEDVASTRRQPSALSGSASTTSRASGRA